MPVSISTDTKCPIQLAEDYGLLWARAVDVFPLDSWADENYVVLQCMSPCILLVLMFVFTTQSSRNGGKRVMSPSILLSPFYMNGP